MDEKVCSALVIQVKKIFESERRLHAGNHSVELLAQDFEKNYNMYIYPVHWQFAQLDQHPSDRCVSWTYTVSILTGDTGSTTSSQ